MSRTARIAATATAVLAFLAVSALPALGHVRVSTNNARPGAVSTLKIHVPNESDSADTIRLDLRLPDGFSFVDARPLKGGWKASADGDVVTLEGGRVPVGEEQDLRIRIRNSRKTGEYVFPVVQTYSDGEKARWVGGEGSDAPAPVLTIAGNLVPVAQTEEPIPSPPAPSGPEASAGAQSSPPAGEQGGGTLTPIIVIVAIAALVAVAAAVTRSRRG